ncbi:Precorrin-6A reductase [Roseivivax jejudonensis]|uniref:Precorrin-6A reductase n=1 Tax=Roseivivax jejudonensis TaxID=1529041 RepID=A0A1X6YS19_9RHOB|nr:precorrin-6A/cobalt-precorrin-6A reductase [Roseivivax jejudonensis]SLN29708.1 Precorrin-6A reductase [Roseivivax jejudonensis]
MGIRRRARYQSPVIDPRSRPVVVFGDTSEARTLAASRATGVVRWRDDVAVGAGPCGAAARHATLGAALRQAEAAALVIALHPFDTAGIAAARAAAGSAGLPCLTLLRPPWPRAPGEQRVTVRNAAALARVIPPGARVFAATGREDLAALRRLDARLWLRLVAPGARVAGARIARGAPPFTVDSEMRLFRRIRPDWLVLRNAGGPGARPKLDAARALGIRVAMIARPPRPCGALATTPEEACRWIDRITPSPAG